MSRAAAASENRFVILLHQFPDDPTTDRAESSHDQRRRDHWDLMFEWEGKLWTWASESEPFKSCPLAAVQLPEHRLDYLTYQGPVSGNRGVVRRVLAGNFRVCPGHDSQFLQLPELVKSGQFRLELHTDYWDQVFDFHRKISFFPAPTAPSAPMAPSVQPAQLAEWEISPVESGC
jgi:hypothetical protein